MVPPYESFALVLSALRGKTVAPVMTIVTAVLEILRYGCWLASGDQGTPQLMMSTEALSDEPLSHAAAVQQLEQVVESSAEPKSLTENGAQAMLALPFVTKQLLLFLAQWLLKEALSGALKSWSPKNEQQPES
jgi:hypothetical protein